MKSKEYQRIIKANETIAASIREGVYKACAIKKENCGSIGAVLKDIIDIYVILLSNPGDNECWIGASYKVSEKSLIVCIDFIQRIQDETGKLKALIEAYQNTFKNSLLQPELVKCEDKMKMVRFSRAYENIDKNEITTIVENTVKDYLKEEHDVILDDLYEEIAKQRQKEK